MTHTETKTDIPSVLQRIVATKVEEVNASREVLSLEDLQAQVAADNKPRRGFAAALRAASTKEHGIGIIAEIKKASPSKGVINHNFAPALFAKQYEQAGASCLSVLTDRDYFQGDDSYLIQAANAVAQALLKPLTEQQPSDRYAWQSVQLANEKLAKTTDSASLKNIATINALRYRSHDQLWSSRYESALTSLTQAKQLAEKLQTTAQASSARPLLANINAEIKAVKTAKDFEP